jgi:hypothetical protein
LQAHQGETSSNSPEPPNQAEQSQAAFRDRVGKALEKATGTRVASEIAESEVLEEAPPKAGNAAAANSSTKGGAAPAASEDPDAAKAADGGKTAEDGAKERAAPQPRYDSPSFTKWMTNNPEKAAELAAKVFKTQLGGNAEEWKKHFVAFENKRRRAAEADEARAAELANEKAQVEKLAKEATEPLQPILDIIEAEQREDYPAIDRFIEATFGISYQEYSTRRLRGLNKKTPSERKLEEELAKAKEELAKAKAPTAPEPAKTELKGPKVSAKWLDAEVPQDHDVRELRDWAKQVEEAYQESFDGEDYGLTVEDAADQVFQAFLAKRAPKTETPAPKPRRKAVKREEHEEEERTPDADIGDWNSRLKSALERAAKRAG